MDFSLCVAYLIPFICISRNLSTFKSPLLTTMSKIISIGSVVAVLVAAAFIFYPKKSAEAKQSLEATGAVAVQKTISALEDRVGKADIALEHYKTVLRAKRESLIQLKTLQASCERQMAGCRAAIEEIQRKGGNATAKQAELKMLEQRQPSLASSVEKAEKGYRQFQLVLKQKKIELNTLKAKTQSLSAELMATSGGDAGYALQEAQRLEEEVQNTCNRLEAELEVQAIDDFNE